MAINKKVVESLDDKELKSLLRHMDALAKADKADKRPETDEELHTWLVDHLGVNIPTVAVCPGHSAPFDVIADLFFSRINAAILVASRGGAKTHNAGLLGYLFCRFIPEIESTTVAAQEIQAKRAYTHYKNFIRKDAEGLVDPANIQRSETFWNSGAKQEILTGSLSSVNGPHPQFCHRDEVELMEEDVYKESLMMEKSKRNSQGEMIPARTLITSTRKASDGLMQKLLDECHEADINNRKPPYKVYMYCIKEVMENQPTCRVGFPDLPDHQKCDCDKVKNGEWDNGDPRTFDTVCEGSFAKAQGFTTLSDAQGLFTKSSKAVWEAQMECKRPYAEDISLEEFSRERHGIYGFEPDPENGPIFQGIDFGGTQPHAVLWAQLLNFEVEVVGKNKEAKRIPEGALVLFHELYIANLGNVELADLIVQKDKEYRYKYPTFGVSSRFADRQAAAARRDFEKHKPPLKCIWPILTRDRQEHFKHIKQRVCDNLLYYDIDNVIMFPEEVEVWNVDRPRKKFDHAVDAVSYICSNVHALSIQGKSFRDMPAYRKSRIKGIPSQFDDRLPKAVPSPLTVNKELPGVDTLPKGEEWRKRFN